MPDQDRRLQDEPPATGRVEKGRLFIQDFGDEVHLWIEQQVPWKVALEILKELKTPAAPDDERERE